MYSQFQLDLSVKVWETFFCNRRFRDCARFALTEAGSPVPLTLLPNGNNLAVTPADTHRPAPVAATGTGAAVALAPVPAPQTERRPVELAAVAPAPEPAATAYSYYLRLPVTPSSDLRETIADTLKTAGVPMDACVVRGNGSGDTHVIVLTADVDESRVEAAVGLLSALEPVTGDIVRIRLEALGTGSRG